MTTRGYGVAALFAVLSLAAGGGAAWSGGDAPVDSTRADSTVTVVKAPTVVADRVRRERAVFHASPYDTTTAEEIRKRHAFSLDHFLETRAGFVVGRRGPIGADADFSRYGVGRARARLYLGSVSLNDPQDDRIPLALVPTTFLGDLVTGDNADVFLPERGNIEGVYQVLEPAPPAEKPLVAVELSTGDRDLRQRRLRFSSIDGPVGVDFEFDELLNDGYQFDARGVVEGSGYGKSTTRMQGGNLRGALPGGANYAFSFRRFTSVFDGDLFAATSELRRDGHLAVIRTSVDRLSLSVFERSHKASAPDSSTGNHTTGVYASSSVELGDAADLLFGAGYEDIHSRQTMGGAESRPRLEKGYLGMTGRITPARNALIVVEAEATHCFDVETGWGAGLTAGKWFGVDNHMVVAFRRRFRMPNLGELFQPRHSVRMDPSVVLAGNRDVREETGLEASAAWLVRVGALTNEIRATAIRVDDPIFFDGVDGGAGGVRVPQNGDREDLVVLDDRADLRYRFLGFLFDLGGSFEYTPSDRVRFFSGVPEYRATATAAAGRDLFKNTSGFRLSAEYLRLGARTAGSIDPLAPYGVLNVKLVVRLVDARLYVQWLNVTDEAYETVWPYLETPRTFVYGVEWTFFD